MKQMFRLIVVAFILFMLGGCSKKENIIIYTGYGESWMANLHVFAYQRYNL